MPTDRSISGLRIVVVGDEGTGKSSLISAAATLTFLPEVPPVLPPARLPAFCYPDNDSVPITIIDTSSSLENWGKLKRADAVVLTYACDRPSTLERLRSFWLHEFRRLKIMAPVVVVGCKRDLVDRDCNCVNENRILIEHRHTISCGERLLMKHFTEIVACTYCSTESTYRFQILEVFRRAQKAALFPTAPLINLNTKVLTPRCMSALKRIFILCDQDMDGSLNDRELYEFKVMCDLDNQRLAAHIEVVLGVIKYSNSRVEGFNKHGLSKDDFLSLHALLIHKGEMEITWCVLRKFGYNDEIKLCNDYLSIPDNHAPDKCKQR